MAATSRPSGARCAGLGSPDRTHRLRQALLKPLGCIHGVSSKVLSMALADLLLAGDPARERWAATGASMIAVDSLVHNWLHRSGSLHQLDAEHPYGVGCYQPGGCAAIIEAASRRIDAQQFCPEGPTNFPRLVQSALWRFCAADKLNVCNGNQIDDRAGCRNDSCPMTQMCERSPLTI